VNSEVGHIIVAAVDAERVAALLNPDRAELPKLMENSSQPWQLTCVRNSWLSTAICLTSSYDAKPRRDTATVN